MFLNINYVLAVKVLLIVMIIFVINTVILMNSKGTTIIVSKYSNVVKLTVIYI